ncbi:MAG: hypothetical protein H6R26_2742 [Proteobacteria bacterium]|nr:hypothetical protein [Pseudomonadota bacterium]
MSDGKAETGDIATAETKYVAFVSYAREDEGFARLLETEIEAHLPPDGRSAAQVFRDRSDFTGSEYHRALENHLRNSETLVVLCSPHARRSEYVGDEIRRFANLRGSDRIFPVLVSGLPDNEADDLKAFPPALLEVMEGGIPLGAEYRGFGKTRDRPNSGRYETEWYKLLGNLYGMSPAEIRARDKQRQVGALRRRYAASLLGVAVLIASLLGVASLWGRALQAEARLAELLAKEQTYGSVELIDARGASEQASTGTTAKPPPPPEAVSAPGTARVYFQIQSNSQTALANMLKKALEAQYLVPPYEIRRTGPTGASELRYFKDGEKEEAERIAATLKKAGLTDVVAKKIPGFEDSTKIRPRHFELWLSPASKGGS